MVSTPAQRDRTGAPAGRVLPPWPALGTARRGYFRRWPPRRGGRYRDSHRRSAGIAGIAQAWSRRASDEATRVPLAIACGLQVRPGQGEYTVAPDLETLRPTTLLHHQPWVSS